MASPFDYDLIILGGGSGGIVSGVMAGGLGRRVLLVEKDRMGGECLNTGCVPSKALIHQAKLAHTIADCGLRIADSGGSPGIDALRSAIRASSLQWVRESIATVREADATEDLLREMGVEIRIGDARFLDEKTILLDGRRIRARAFILATGSRPARPEIEGLEAAGYLTNTELFDLPEPPESLLVIGGGPVGVEMAQAFQRLGTRVTLVQRGPQILRRDDEELTALLLQILRDEGVDVRLSTVPVRVRPETNDQRAKGGKRVTLRGPDGVESDVVAAEILVAVGRRPNVEGLELEAAGVAYDERRVKVDARMRTTGRRVWAVGDVTGGYQFSHMAEYEAKTAVWNILFPFQKRASFRVAPWTTFTDPELATVGMTESELQANDIRYTVLRQSFAQNDRALTDSEGVGLVKVLVRPGVRGQILGVQILGPRAGELIQEWSLAMQRKNGIATLADLIHVYPTLSMASQHAAQRWYQQMGESRRLRLALGLFFRLRGFAPRGDRERLE
jgi:pyruvate/2-oxoglutarate dehydrogenase complex dihydrolipoamide dehydrogenase (E3) component